MGSEQDTVNQANKEKTTYDRTFKNMKIGVCEMQGWRTSMEDAAIVLPNFEKNTSLFGILDGHGGSIISEFVSVNFKNVLIRTKSYKKGHYENALCEAFLIMDELLRSKRINNFIYNTHNQKNEPQEKLDENTKKKDSVIKLMFENGCYEYDLDEIDLAEDSESIIETTLLEYNFKTNTNKEKNIEMNLTADDSKTRIDTELLEEKSGKVLQLNEIFFSKGGKQNSSLNHLPTFEEVCNIKKYNLKFTKKIRPNNEFNNSSKNIKVTHFVAYEMGTTANIILIKNNTLYLANVGDSLSVMYKNNKAYNLNREHQTILEEEKERVLRSGATINGYRINGMLNLTRAIGDFRFKSNRNLRRCEQSVIALPEITKIDNIDDIDFIIMGCDGVWDCVKRQLICEFVENEIKENKNCVLSDILIKIFDQCVSDISGIVLGTDNMSCIIIQFLNNKSENIEEKVKIHKVNINFKQNNVDEIIQEAQS